MFDNEFVLQDNKKVIRLERFLDGASLSPVRQVEAYWTALREEGGIPRRSQIDPRGISGVLEHTLIIERIAPGVARFRIAGQHLCRLAGMEVRGMPVTTFFTPPSRGKMSAVIEHMFDAPAMAELELELTAIKPGQGATARMILLPLRGESGRIDRALGALVAPKDVVANGAPIRFAIGATMFRSIGGVAHIEDTTGAKPKAEPDVPGFAEAQTPFVEPPEVPATRRKPGAPHLRLIKS